MDTQTAETSPRPEEDNGFDLSALPPLEHKPKTEQWPAPKFKKDEIVSAALIKKLGLSQEGKSDNWSNPEENLWVTLEPNPRNPDSYRVTEESHGGGY